MLPLDFPAMRLVFLRLAPIRVAVPLGASRRGARPDARRLAARKARSGGTERSPTPAVARLGKERGLPLFQPQSLKPDETVARLAQAGADLFVVVAYGKILPQRVLDLPRLGAVNVHGSVLPRWRGASPVQAAILAGDAVTGVTIMKMDAGMDTGPVFATSETEIGERDTAETLGARLAEMGAALLA